jgi:hypothetical protein
MIRIHHIDVTRQQLDAVPDAERRLLVMVAHAANELNVLAKLFHFTAKGQARTPMLQQAENAQALVLGRLLTGKLYECWQLLQSAFFRSGLSKKYEPDFDKEASEALDALKRYFGRKNLIEAVRNKYAFHYSAEQVDSGYATLVDGDPLAIYLAEASLNTLYTFADTIAGRAMLEVINPGDHKKAFEMLVDETAKVVGHFNIVIGAMMVTCLTTYMGIDARALEANVIEVTNAPDVAGVSIPYFVEIGKPK